ncbi:hypothetical protein BGX31_004705 [Mortierella sp. GBA43]|nr:hypothetical protein BGX31_004705 [Mortierella sp. GBA43]
MGSFLSRFQRRPRVTQEELQREYQRNLEQRSLEEQRMTDHMNARQTLENNAHSMSQDLKQIPGINGHAPSVIASTVNNESFYQPRTGTLHSGSNGAKSGPQNHCWIDGRRHHNMEEAPYVLPNDIDEMDRVLDLDDSY